MSNDSNTDVKMVEENEVTIQSDWQSSFSSSGKDKFFVNYKKFGAKSETYNFDCENGEIKLGEDSKNTAERQGRKLRVKLENGAARTFVAPQISYETVHKGSVYSVAISSTENICVSSDTNGQLAIWETNRGNKVRDLEGHVMDVYKCRFFPSGLVVLSGGMDMTVRIFAVDNGWNARTMVGHKGPVYDLGVIEEGENVVSCSKDGTLKVWNCGEGQVIQEWAPGSGHLNALALSDLDLHLIGTASESQKAFIYDMRSSETAFEFDTHGTSTSICFDSGMHLFVGNENGSINVFDLRTKKEQMCIKTQRGRVNRLLHQGVLGLVGAFNDGTLTAYHDETLFTTAEPTIEFTGSDCDPIYDASVSPNALISGCRDKVIRKYSFE